MNPDESKKLDEVRGWQIKHEKDDTLNFGEIRSMLEVVADKKVIENSVIKAVQVTVNGKLVEIKNHLLRQDEDSAKKAEDLLAIMETLGKLDDKVKPLSATRDWLVGLKGVIIGTSAVIGAIAVISAGIMYLLGILK